MIKNFFGIYKTEILTKSIDNNDTIIFKNSDISDRFSKYHLENAKFRIVSFNENISIYYTEQKHISWSTNKK